MKMWRSLVLIAVLLHLSASLNGPPLLHLSDLPDDIYTHHMPTIHPVDETHVPVGLDECSVYATCFKCLDHEDRCGWCVNKEGQGTCMSGDSLRAGHCKAIGGSLSHECPFFTRDLYITTAVIAACAMLSAGGGIGGGAMFVPVFLMIYGLSPHQAVPLSKITIFGLGIGGFVVLVSKRHPLRDAPLIDYDLVGIMVPMILLGTIGGVFLNVIFPSLVIVGTLVVLLSYTSYKSWKKSFSLYREENARDASSKGDTIEVELEDLGPEESEGGDTERPLVVSDELSVVIRREAAFPWRKFGIFAVCYFGLLTFVLLKGGSSGTSIVGVSCGTPAFWIILLCAIPYMTFLVWLVARRLVRETAEKDRLGWHWLHCDVRYTMWICLRIGLLACASGIAAGGLGIGAGMVVAPIMMELGVLPEISQASSSFVVLFTSSSTSLQFILLGKLPWRAAIWFGCVGLSMSMVGQNLVAWLLKRYQKQYLLAFFLSAMISISGLFMFVLQMHDMAKGSMHFTNFRGPCATSIA